MHIDVLVTTPKSEVIMRIEVFIFKYAPAGQAAFLWAKT